MTERPTYVVDATVVGKWFLQGLPDEPLTDQALQLLHDFKDSAISLLAPYHLTYEVPSILCKAIGSQRLEPTSALEAVDTFLAYPIRTIRSTSLVHRGVRSAIRYQCLLYDALCLALAEAGGYPFIHADSKLHRTLRGRFPFELWLGDYQPIR